MPFTTGFPVMKCIQTCEDDRAKMQCTFRVGIYYLLLKFTSFYEMAISCRITDQELKGRSVFHPNSLQLYAPVSQPK